MAHAQRLASGYLVTRLLAESREILAILVAIGKKAKLNRP
jgi:hypothetical protein